MGLVSETNLLKQLEGLGFSLRLCHALHLDRCLHDILHGSQMREQIEPLEDHAHTGALGSNVA